MTEDDLLVSVDDLRQLEACVCLRLQMREHSVRDSGLELDEYKFGLVLTLAGLLGQ